MLRLYLKGRKGDVSKAAEILARALQWREQYRDVLSGVRVPKWQGDFRILSLAYDGHPLLYLHLAALIFIVTKGLRCCRHQTHAFNISDTLEHVAVAARLERKSGDFRAKRGAGDSHQGHATSDPAGLANVIDSSHRSVRWTWWSTAMASCYATTWTHACS